MAFKNILEMNRAENQIIVITGVTAQSSSEEMAALATEVPMKLITELNADIDVDAIPAYGLAIDGFSKWDLAHQRNAVKAVAATKSNLYLVVQDAKDLVHMADILPKPTRVIEIAPGCTTVRAIVLG